MRGQLGLMLHTQVFPTEDARAGVVIVHGYGEHSGRYTHVIAALNDAGYSAYALDHRGHGRSEGLRGYVDQMDYVIDDLHAYIAHEVSAINGTLPLFILGHSMGALITLAYGIRHAEADGIAGLIASAPPVIADANISPALVWIGELLNCIVPTRPLADTVPLSTLSHDPAVLRAFEQDPLTYKGKMRVGTGIQINHSARWVRDHLGELRLPLLLVHGEADAAVTVQGSRLAYAQAASIDKKLITYPDLYHEIMNEPQQAEVLGDIIAWLNARSSLTINSDLNVNSDPDTRP